MMGEIYIMFAQVYIVEATKRPIGPRETGIFFFFFFFFFFFAMHSAS
jgi:hypothetical protein